MERLGTRDLGALLDFLQGIYAWQTRDALLRYVITRLPTIIQSESTSHNEINLRLKQNVLLVDPPDYFVFPNHRKIFREHIHEHPLVAHYQRTGDTRVRKISDFLSQTQFHRLALYNEFFRRVKVEHQIAFTLRLDRARLTGIALPRGRRDFSERDRLCLELLRPHLIRAYGNVEVITRVQRALQLTNRYLEGIDHGVIVLNAVGRVRTLIGSARQYLVEFFASPSRLPHHLPETLRRWAHRQDAVLTQRDDVPRAPEPLIVDREGKRLVVRFCSFGGQRVLLLEARATVPQPQALECLGLSRRQAEVLAWIAAGKTNREIGSILGASFRTVGKHTEQIFQKLGVETRTAAAARALQAGRPSFNSEKPHDPMSLD